MEGYLQYVASQCGPCVKAQDVMTPQGRQNEHHRGFVGKATRYDCGQCITAHATERGFPPLGVEHVEAWNLWFTVQSQQRAGGMGEPGGLDYGVLPAIFDLEGVPTYRRRRLFHELAALNDAVQAKRAREAETQRLAAAGRAGVARVDR